MWSMMIQSSVFTRIKNEVPKSIKVGTSTIKLSSKNFSTVGSSDTPAVFPFVFVQELPAVERGQTIDGQSINGGLFTFQIDVTDNVSQERARAVMTEVLRVVKEMRFEVISMPSFEFSNGTHRMTMRCRRMIGALDTL